MKKILLVFVLLNIFTVPILAQKAKISKITTVECWPEKDKSDSAHFLVDNKGYIKAFATTSTEDGYDLVHIARVNKKQDSLFSNFANFMNADGDATVQKFKNGYTSIHISSTADAETVGINLVLGKGFYKYEDLGSGTGNSSEVLVCKKTK